MSCNRLVNKNAILYNYKENGQVFLADVPNKILQKITMAISIVLSYARKDKRTAYEINQREDNAVWRKGMKLKYLGTSASEGIPTMGCSCPVCQKAREKKGRYIRTHSQAMLNGDLLLDFNADAYMHMLKHDINMQSIGNVLITHPHWDHFYPIGFMMLNPKFSTTKRKNPWHVYGGSGVTTQLQALIDESVDWFDSNYIDAFQPIQVGDYEVCALEAAHGTGLEGGYYIYLISRDGKSMMYCHDTDGFTQATWEYLKKTKPKVDLFSLDCTRGAETSLYKGHMNLEKCKLLRRQLLEAGIADENTAFVLSHFSHNGECPDYDDICKVAEPQGFVVAYDGLEIEC